MSIRIRIELDVDDNADKEALFKMMTENYFRVSFRVDASDHVEEPDELSDDETAEDALKVLAWDQRLAAMESAVSAGEPPPEADPTPPHGIERPAKVLTGGHPYTRPADYWVDERKGHVTGSMQRPIPDINTVQCPTCTAGVGERCITSNHVGYRDGFGHTARRHLYEATHQAVPG